jgi:hypothetical protein
MSLSPGGRRRVPSEPPSRIKSDTVRTVAAKLLGLTAFWMAGCGVLFLMGRELAPSRRYGPDSEEATSKARKNMPNQQAEHLYRITRVLLPITVALFGAAVLVFVASLIV